MQKVKSPVFTRLFTNYVLEGLRKPFPVIPEIVSRLLQMVYKNLQGANRFRGIDPPAALDLAVQAVELIHRFQDPGPEFFNA